jgi:hypothetical protein
MKFGAARRKSVLVFQIAVLGHRAFDLVVADDGPVVVVEDGEEFFAVDVNEEIVLAVEMERRSRIRRRHEQKSLDLFEAGVQQAVEAARPRHRQQRVFEQRPVCRRVFDALEHHPGAGGLDAFHHLDRVEIEGGDRIGVLADRDLARIVFDQVARQFGGKPCDARQRQQRMAGQLVADRERF